MIRPITDTKISLFYIVSCCCLAIGYMVKIWTYQHGSFRNVEYIFLGIGMLSVLYIRKKNFLNPGILFLSALVILWIWNEDTDLPLAVNLAENAARWCLPIAVFCLTQKLHGVQKCIKVAVAATFTAHGLLALNIIATPPSFYMMCYKILHLDVPSAKIFLSFFGVMDIIASLLLLFTGHKFSRAVLSYCFTWGLITAFARTWSMMDESVSKLLVSGIAETLIRIPNALLPLILLLVKVKKRNIGYQFVKRSRRNIVVYE